MSIDPSEKESYREISRAKVATSNQIDDNVIADYDAMGNVVGLEFLDPAAVKEWEKFLSLANQKTPGASKLPTPPGCRRGRLIGASSVSPGDWRRHRKAR